MITNHNEIGGLKSNYS